MNAILRGCRGRQVSDKVMKDFTAIIESVTEECRKFGKQKREYAR